MDEGVVLWGWRCGVMDGGVVISLAYTKYYTLDPIIILSWKLIQANSLKCLFLVSN